MAARTGGGAVSLPGETEGETEVVNRERRLSRIENGETRHRKTGAQGDGTSHARERAAHPESWKGEAIFSDISDLGAEKKTEVAREEGAAQTGSKRARRWTDTQRTRDTVTGR